MDFIINTLTLTVRFSAALLMASRGEMFNQKAGIFNLGCEGVMSMGAFLGMLIPFSFGGASAVLFTFAQVLQTQVQIFVPQFQYYEFLTMLPYILVIVVLAFNRESNKLGSAALGKPFNREMRV